MTIYAERSTFKVGGVTFPLVPDGYQDSIIKADPLIYNILQFFKSVIITYTGDFWTHYATKANLTGADGYIISAPIKQLITYSPVDYLQEVQYKFPLLSATRTNETYKEKTREWYELSYQLQMLYMLPPLTAAQMYHMDSFRSLIRSVILDRLELGYDPSYHNGEQVFKTAGIDQISFVKSDYLGLDHPIKPNTFFPTIMMTFDVKERKNYVEGSFPDLTIINGSTTKSDGYAPNDFDLIDFQTPSLI
jgi:hypothetical protein